MQFATSRFSSDNFAAHYLLQVFSSFSARSRFSLGSMRYLGVVRVARPPRSNRGKERRALPGRPSLSHAHFNAQAMQYAPAALTGSRDTGIDPF